MKLSSIQQLKNSLQKFGYHCVGGDEADPNLQIVLGKNEEEKFWNLLIQFNDMPLEPKPNGTKAHFMQFFLVFPYDYERESTAELARLLLMFNKSAPFPGFGLSEVDKKIYYKYSLNCERGAIPIALACSIVGMITLYIDSLSPMIKSVALYKRQVHEVMEDALRLVA
jgi:hypothetical protein